MKTLFNLLTLGLILGSAACAPSSGGDKGKNDLSSPKTFALDQCPVLEGEYETEDRRQTITEKRTDKQYSLILGEGAEELVIDGKAHTLPEGATYRGFCENGQLKIEATHSGKKIQLVYFFNKEGLLVQTVSGEQNETILWTKK